MPQTNIGSSNIETFGFSAVFDPMAQSVTFDIADLTTFNNVSGSGYLYVLGVAFSVIDQDGVTLASVDWDAPQIDVAAGDTTWVLDLSDVGVDFFFQTYKIIGYIKDGDGSVYSTTQVNKKVCQPVDITQDGYVPGVFQVTANCVDNVITVKEVTKLVYNNLEPESTTKDGTLTYPTGTISPIEFTGTPFTNDEIYTGEYRVTNTTISRYDIGDDTYVDVSYVTNNVFDVTCANKVQDILCCLVALQKTKTENCNNAIGERAAQQLSEIEIPFFIAIAKEMSGQDASQQVDYIKKKLSCDCGSKSIIRNEFTPINPSVTNIVLSGVGGTTIAAPTINGNTKTYNIASKVYQVVKGDVGDDSFTITIDTNTANNVKYVITINYLNLSANVLTQIAGNTTLLTQFNSLVNISNFYVDLTNLNGGCIIDISAISYFFSIKVPSAANTIVSILINGTTYTAGSPIAVNNPTAIESWLNGLGLGTFNASFSTGTGGSYFNVLTEANANTITSAVVNTGTNTTVLFQKTTQSLIAFLQAVVDYICALSAVNIALGADVTVCYVDYNGDTITTTYPSTSNQGVLNEAVAQALCSTVAQINTVFRNGLTKSGAYVHLGGGLIEDTDITLNNKYLRVVGLYGSGVVFAGAEFWSYQAAGTGASDLVTYAYQLPNYAKILGSIVSERETLSYYAKGLVRVDPSNEEAILGSYYPNSDSDSFPAPALDPQRTSFVKASFNTGNDEGELEFYGATQTHTGSNSNFDTLVRVKRMTTAERDAIDISLLDGGVIIFNTDVTANGKLQCYDDAGTWNNLW